MFTKPTNSVLTAVLLLGLATNSAASESEYSYRVAAYSSTSKEAEIGCPSGTSCDQWHVYTLKVVAGPSRGQTLRAAQRSDKKMPHWKLKNKKIVVRKIKDQQLVDELGAEFLLLPQ